MRVLVIGLNYTPEPTGIAPYTAALARRLADRGHEVRVLTAMPHYPAWKIHEGYGGWTRHETIDGVKVTRMRHYVPSRPSGVRRLVSEISFGLRVMMARTGKPDAIVFVSPALFSTALGMVKARLLHRSIPTIVWVQDLYSLGVVETGGGSSGGAVARAITQVESRVLAEASGVCVIHDRLVAVAALMGATEGSVHVVRNWTHLPHLLVGPRAVARRRLGWGNDEVVALHTGAMGQKQDLGNVVSAARVAESRGEHLRFVLMGDGGRRSALEADADGVHTIEFMDPLPDDQYQEALAAADVLILNEHSGLREMAVPSKLTSYFSSGRPVVAATDAGSVTAAEIAASGAGVRVAPGNPAALVNAVLALRDDPERAEDLGRLGRIYRDSVLSEEAALDEYEGWLTGLSAERTRARHGS